MIFGIPFAHLVPTNCIRCSRNNCTTCLRTVGWVTLSVESWNWLRLTMFTVFPLWSFKPPTDSSPKIFTSESCRSWCFLLQLYRILSTCLLHSCLLLNLILVIQLSISILVWFISCLGSINSVFNTLEKAIISLCNFH